MAVAAVIVAAAATTVTLLTAAAVTTTTTPTTNAAAAAVTEAKAASTTEINKCQPKKMRIETGTVTRVKYVFAQIVPGLMMFFLSPPSPFLSRGLSGCRNQEQGGQKQAQHKQDFDHRRRCVVGGQTWVRGLCTKRRR